VEDSNKHIIEETVRQVDQLPELLKHRQADKTFGWLLVEIITRAGNSQIFLLVF
jgi:hypothetical protein